MCSAKALRSEFSKDFLIASIIIKVIKVIKFIKVKVICKGAGTAGVSRARLATKAGRTAGAGYLYGVRHILRSRIL